jgi:hypothetical protein
VTSAPKDVPLIAPKDVPFIAPKDVPFIAPKEAPSTATMCGWFRPSGMVSFERNHREIAVLGEPRGAAAVMAVHE